MSTVSSGPSPALTHRSPLPGPGALQSIDDGSKSNLDLSLATAITHLAQHLIQPLSAHYPHSTLLQLRHVLARRLTKIFEPSWQPLRPTFGSGSRSLICSRYHGLPTVLKQAAEEVAVEQDKWRKAIAGIKSGDRGEEWEAWCDPGQVVWRWGGWEWEDPQFEPFKVVKEPFLIIWQASSSSPSLSPQTPNAAPIHTPARTSHAIPIRAPSAAGPLTPGPTGHPPTLFAIPPTPASETTLSMPLTPSEDRGDLLPAFASLGLGQAPGQGQRGHVASGWTSSDASSRVASLSESHFGDSRSVSGSSARSEQDHSDQENDEGLGGKAARGSHRVSESSSSLASSGSESNSGHTQLLTPASRADSLDPFTVPLLSLKDKKDDKSRKITPPGLHMPRGRTPSPNPSATTDTQTITPGTEASSTPSSAPAPSVTPYDGGNVTVLGGGVKLGGASRPSSGMSSRSVDRSRSPSISLASRALTSATGPNANGEAAPRKQRTRRRIMPTYLGHLGQPGVGGPVMGVFGQFAGAPKAGVPATTFAPAPGGHVGVGVSPPVIGRVPVPMPRMG
ncbi:hypothetical protein IAU60_006160 [Kwoniella sp. DSM 27419]